MEKQKLLFKDADMIIDMMLDVAIEDDIKKRMDLYHDFQKYMFENLIDWSTYEGGGINE